MAKRITPEEDVERLAERVWNFGAGTITDKDSFDKVFDEYMEELTSEQDTKLRRETFNKLRGKHPSVERPRKRKARRLPRRKVVEREKFEIIGEEIIKKAKRKRVVYIRKSTVTIRGRKVIVYRDRKGRFAKRKKK